MKVHYYYMEWRDRWNYHFYILPMDITLVQILDGLPVDAAPYNVQRRNNYNFVGYTYEPTIGVVSLRPPDLTF